ncbi:MAG: hypothetical protein ACLFUB_19205 [Cyclobacteriaceae bacterium]
MANTTNHLLLSFLLSLSSFFQSAAQSEQSNSQPPGPDALMETYCFTHQGEQVEGRRLRVSVVLPISADTAWQLVQRSALLQYVAKGRIRFKPDGDFPPLWHEGDTVSTRMLIYGLIPFGGRHVLRVKTIDHKKRRIQTEETNHAVAVWQHQVNIEPLDAGRCRYEDEIVIFAGKRTGFISRWAKSFYIHRQKRWLKLASSPKLQSSILQAD